MSLPELDNLVRVRQLKPEPAEQWRVLQQAHNKRNLAEYEGDGVIDEALLAALIRIAIDVSGRLAKLQ